ncbi:putative transposase domain protein [Shigella sonnei 4822-66]|nr:putative transposase domain protein [Shigella sonnei 4822-66]
MANYRLISLALTGDLSAVYVPGIEDEAFRNLARAWASARDDLRHARQRLKSFFWFMGSIMSGEQIGALHTDAGSANTHSEVPGDN